MIDRTSSDYWKLEGALRWCRVSELDHLREEVAYLKFWLGIVVVTDISLAGWLISSSGTAGPYTVFFAVLGLILLSAGIVFLHRRIERRIDRIKEL